MPQSDSTKFDQDEAGRQLGYDLFQHGFTATRTAWNDKVLEGYALAKARGACQIRSDRFIRKWLQLRLNALSRNRVVDSGVRPSLLRDIDVAQCPVLRVVLTHGELTGSDWSIDRLNNDGAYAPHNLAVISTQANRAKSDLSYEEVYRLSQLAIDTDGLTPQQWLRMAAIMLGPCFAARPTMVPIIPLAAPIPKLTVRLATQQIQYAFTVNAARASGKNLVIKQLLPACRREISRMRMSRLVERVHENMKGLAYPWDAWLAPQVMEAFMAWHASMTIDEWAKAGALSMQLAGARPVSATRLHLWRLGNLGCGG